MAAIFGITGEVTSWTNNTQLIATGGEPAAVEIVVEADEHDVTTFAATANTAYLQGLYNWTCQITQQLKTAVTGTNGLVTFSAGYVTNLRSWDMTIEADEGETTAFGATSRTYTPGLLSVSGTFEGYYDDTTVATLPANSNEPATGTFKIREAGGTDDTLSFSMFTKRLGVTSNPRAINTIAYSFRGSGAITQSTPSAGTTLFATGALAVPTAGTLTVAASTNQTFAGSAFWNSVNIHVEVGQPVVVTVGVRGSGDYTLA